MAEKQENSTELRVIKSNALAKVSANMRINNKLAISGIAEKFNSAFCLLNGIGQGSINFLGKLQYDYDYRKVQMFKYKASSPYNYTRSINIFTEITKTKPRHYLSFEFIGIANIMINNNNRALSAFNKAIAINPNYAYAYYNRSLVYSNTKKLKFAQKDIDKALQLDSQFAKAYIAKGSILHQSKNYSKAEEMFDKGIALSPKDANGYYNRALLHKSNKKNKFAMNDLDKSIHIMPDFADAYNSRGLLHKSMGNYRGAVEDFKIAAKLSPYYRSMYGDAYGNNKDGSGLRQY